ncbi:huntingtin-interacting protein K [Parambassis ranga]|uniref:Huntingtin-interacting protein K n=17 Tax=Percomorphaceae TaxID=1489872 RepID=A0A6P7HXG8_9TELE|nr:huntingtin-interacting protein K [Parambassis ranga]
MKRLLGQQQLLSGPGTIPPAADDPAHLPKVSDVSCLPVLLRIPSATCRNPPFCSGLTGANMAAEGDVDLDLEAEENCTGKPAEKPRKHDSGAADLERVTDYAEEKEISSSDLETAMSVIGDRRSREQKAKQEREKELAKVTIKKEDVELIMSEMEISRAVAERSLREHMGNVVEALVALTN